MNRELEEQADDQQLKLIHSLLLACVTIWLEIEDDQDQSISQSVKLRIANA